MRSQRTATLWTLPTACASLALAVAALGHFGIGEPGTIIALRLTARLAFVLFWLSYTGSALAVLFGPTLQPLKRRSRELGLAFATAQLVHVGLVIWLCWIGAAPSGRVFVVFGIALVFTCALALFSIGRLQRMLHPRTWRLLKAVGLNYILYAFAKDFLKDPLGGGPGHIVAYLPFFVLAIAGPVLRVLAWTVQIMQAPNASWGNVTDP